MVKELIHDAEFLAQRSEPADESDLQTVQDLLDTIAAHKDSCVGMAANMIGVRKRIIVFEEGENYTVMLNPEIIKKSEPYEAEERCLSLLGGARKAKRFGKIKVKFQNEKMQERVKNFEGISAQIIQHEIDHCEGILI